MRERVQQAFAALDERGDVGVFRELLAEVAQWLGVDGGGYLGETPT
jgi:hypothetical protein